MAAFQLDWQKQPQVHCPTDDAPQPNHGPDGAQSSKWATHYHHVAKVTTSVGIEDITAKPQQVGQRMVSTSLPSQIASAKPLPICSNTLRMCEKPVKTVCTATDEISAARPTSSLANPYEPSVALCTLTMSTYNGVPALRLPRSRKEVRHL